MITVKKVLPVVYPSVTGYTPMAGLFSILEGYDYTKPWRYGNYIQIAFSLRKQAAFINSFDLTTLPGFHGHTCCPWISYSAVNRDTISMLSPSFVDFAVKSIDTGNYLYFVVDQFYLSGTGSGKNHVHLPHDIFVYGYDSDRSVFYVGDFLFRNKFSFEQVPFCEMEDGYRAVANDFINFNRGGVGLWSFHEDIRYEFDVRFVKEQFVELRDSFDLSEHFRGIISPNYTSSAYGMRAYALIAEILRSSEDSPKGLLVCAHNLLDHKELMLQRLAFMSENGWLGDTAEIIAGYRQIRDEFKAICNRMIKYIVAEKAQSIRSLADRMEDAAETERSVVDRIIENIVA